jgi:hypothetical protein
MAATNEKTKKAAAPTEKVAQLEKQVGAIGANLEEVNDTLDQVVKSQNQIAQSLEAFQQTMAAFASTRAVDNPVVLNKHHEAAEQELGGGGAAEFAASEGPVLDENFNNLIIPMNFDISTPAGKIKAEYEAFMREPLTVHIHSNTDLQSEKVFAISVNGRPCLFKRDETKTVPRMYVEGLARAKPVGYDNQEYLRNDGRQDVRYPEQVGLRYSFSLVNAKPSDQAWLNHVLRQP